MKDLVKNLRGKQRVLILGALSIISVVIAAPVVAKVRYFTLVEKVRQSDIVILGSISELRADHVIVTVTRVLKGSVPDKDIEVAWDREDKIEKPMARHEVGHEILFFGSKAGARYAPFLNCQGTLKLEKGSANKYEEAVKTILEYDVSKSTEQKKTILKSMLQGGNSLLHDAALGDIIYLDLQARKTGIVSRDLVPDIIKLVRGADKNIAVRAAQALDRIGGDESLSVLIDLVGGEDSSLAQIAAIAVSIKTGVAKEIDRRQSRAERQKAMREWQDWWQRNKGKVKLRE